jgi:phosphate-selective porin OprO/OprP
MQSQRASALTIAIAGLLGGVDTAEAVVSDEQYHALERRLLQLEKRLGESEGAKAAAPAVGGAVVGASGSEATAGAVVATENADEVKQLKQKVNLLERRVEIGEETAEKVRKEVPKIDAGSGGFKWSSADGQHALRLGGYIQADGDFFMDDHTDDTLFTNSSEGDKFWIRRGRITLDGRMFKYVNFRIMPDFSQGNVRLFDAYRLRS